MSETAIHTKLATKSCEPDRSKNQRTITGIRNRKRNVTTREVKIENNDRKQYLITRCPDFKPTSFRFVYNEKWVVEDDSHFSVVLNRNKIKIPNDKESRTVALQTLKKKKQLEGEDFTIDEQDEDIDTSKKNIGKLPPEVLPSRPIDRILYEDLGANQVKVIRRNPFKLAWTKGRFCQHETISGRRMVKLQQRGIDINRLQKENPDEYYDQFTRCYADGTRQLDGKYYCETHYRHVKYGMNLSEDFNDIA